VFLGVALSGYNNPIILLSYATVILAAASLSELKLNEIPAPGLMRRLPAKWIGKVFQLRWFLLACMLLIGMDNIIGIVNPITILSGPDDQPAYAWIQANTLPDSVFLVPSVEWSSLYLPSDGGGWIPAFTGRRIITPASQTDYADLPSFMAEHPSNYLYLGQGTGAAGQSVLRNLQNQCTLVYQVGEVKILVCNKNWIE
jgi:hypothetical protein